MFEEGDPHHFLAGKADAKSLAESHALADVFCGRVESWSVEVFMLATQSFPLSPDLAVPGKSCRIGLGV